MLLSRLLCEADEFAGFQDSCSGLKTICGKSYDYTGANFDSSGIVSIKLYKTFFGDQEFFSIFPFPELKERFLSYQDKVSRYHTTTPLIPGCGVTYALKVDNEGSFSKGVYFRVCCDVMPYVEAFLSRMGLPDSLAAFFDGSGVLKYISVDGKGLVRERSYVYCLDPSVMGGFDSVSGISFSKADCLEISTGWEDDSVHSSMSIIGLSPSSLAGEEIRSRGGEVERELRESGVLQSTNFSLYGYYLQRGIHSVFFFDNKVERLPSFRSGSPEMAGAAR